jgi:uncharacterized protein (DUF362 family)
MVRGLAVVSIVQNADVGLAVREAINFVGGIESFVHPNEKVVIKPNLVLALPSETGMTTDPRVVQAIVELCESVNPSDVIIAEGSGGTDTKIAFDRCGYSKLARKYGVKLIDLNESKTTMVSLPEGKAFQVLNVPKVIIESDVLINVPKLKFFERWVSLSIKNLLGAVPGKGEYSQTLSPDFPLKLSGAYCTPEGRFFGPRGEKKKVHENLAEGLADLNMIVKPSLNLIDGIIACYGDRPLETKEKPIELNTILAGEDPLAVDCVATKISELNPLDIPYMKCAAERGLGESDHNRIQVLGTPLLRIATAWKTELTKLNCI